MSRCSTTVSQVRNGSCVAAGGVSESRIVMTTGISDMTTGINYMKTGISDMTTGISDMTTGI